MFGFHKHGKGIGLHRAEKFFNYVNIPLDHFQEISIVVTGSNGKGSTARFISSMLQDQFDHVGCFVSPHLINVTERFQINNTRISPDKLNDYKSKVIEFNTQLSDDDFIGAFELLFYIAILWFYEHKVDVVVWEAGIGGRYDPTRALRASISVLTSIDLEHTELLGATKELIAYDKLDASRSGGHCVISTGVDESLLERIKAYVRVTGRTYHYVGEEYDISNVKREGNNQNFQLTIRPSLVSIDLSINMLGDFQISNVLAAIATTRIFLKNMNLSIAFDKISHRISDVIIPGRMEQVMQEPSVWIDVGHTPDAIDKTTHAFLDMFERDEIIVVHGVSKNKNYATISKIIDERFDNIILTQAYKNGATVQQLTEVFNDKHKILNHFSRIEDCVEFAINVAKKTDKTIIVLGGLFLAVEFKYALQGHNPQDLDFF